jgi:hypothetical protein
MQTPDYTPGCTLVLDLCHEFEAALGQAGTLAQADAQGDAPAAAGRQLAESSRRMYARDVRAICAWYERSYGAPLRAEGITADMLSRYRQWCASRVSAGAFNRRKAAVSRFCIWAIERGYLARNPARDVPGAKWNATRGAPPVARSVASAGAANTPRSYRINEQTRRRHNGKKGGKQAERSPSTA